MDEVIDINYEEVLDCFESCDCDAGVITFNSSHPRWSYIIKDNEEFVLSAHEKNVISKNALAGFYYFKNKSTFASSAFQVLLDDCKYNNRFYLSSTLNEIILQGGSVKSYQIDSSKYHSLYTPQKVSGYLDLLSRNSTSVPATE